MDIYLEKFNICLKCGMEWEKRTSQSPRCPNCKTSKWYEITTEHEVFSTLGEDFVLVNKDPIGMDFLSVYHFMSLKTRQLFVAFCNEHVWEIFTDDLLERGYRQNFFERRERFIKNDTRILRSSFYLYLYI